MQKSGNPAKWSKKVNRVLRKFLEKCLSQKFFELNNQCLIFHGFAVTITEAKEFQTDKVKLLELLKLEENSQGNWKERRRNMSAWFGRIVFPFILGYGFYQLLKPG